MWSFHVFSQDPNHHFQSKMPGVVWATKPKSQLCPTPWPWMSNRSQGAQGMHAILEFEFGLLRSQRDETTILNHGWERQELSFWQLRLSGIICLSHSAGGVAWFGDARDLGDRQLNWIHLAIGFLGPTSWIRIHLCYAHIQQTYTYWDVYTCMIVYVYQTKSVRYVHVINKFTYSSYTHNCPELSTFMLPSSTPIQPLLVPLAFGVGPGRTT